MNNYLFKRMNRELRKMKYRALGSAVLIVLSVPLYIGMAGMVPNTEKALEDKVEELRLNDYLVHVNGANETETENLSAIQGIADVEARLQVSGRVDYRDGGRERNSAAYLYGIDPARQPTINIPELFGDDSRYFDEIDPPFDENASDPDAPVVPVLLERNFANSAGLDVGDALSMNAENGSVELSIIGLVFTPEFIMVPANPNSLLPYPGNLAVLFVPAGWLRGAYGFPAGFVNEFMFMFDGDVTGNGDAEKALRDEINAQLADDIIIYSTPRDQVYGYAFVKEDLSQGDANAAIFAGIILMVAFFIVYVSFVRTVQEQRKEIGILRALGYSRRAVFGSYLYMALVIGLIGSLAGVLLGIPLAKAMGEFYVELMIGTSLEGFTIAWKPVIVGLFFGPLTACFASGIAAWGTATMEPQDAIRGTPRSVLKSLKLAGKQPLWKKLFPPGRQPDTAAHGTGTAPERNRHDSGIAQRLKRHYIVHYTIKGMVRNRVRTVLTAVAVALSILIAALPFLMLDSFVNSMEKSVDDFEKWDVMVEYAYPLNETQAATIHADGITDLAYISRIQGTWQKRDRSEVTLIAGLDLAQRLHLFNRESGRLAAAPNEIMVNSLMADKHGVRVGDTLTLRAANGQIDLTVTALVTDTLGEIYVDMSVMEQLSGEVLYSGMYANTEPGTAKAVRDGLRESPLVSEAVTRDGTKSGLLNLMDSTENLLYVFSFMGIAIAAATLANTVFIGVLERYYEFGQLRAIGYGKRTLAKSVMLELGLLVSIGSLLGAPLTYLTLLGYESEFAAFFPLYETVIRPGDWLDYLVVVGMTFPLALLAALPSIRLVGRMDIAKTVSGARFG